MSRMRSPRPQWTARRPCRSLAERSPCGSSQPSCLMSKSRERVFYRAPLSFCRCAASEAHCSERCANPRGEQSAARGAPVSALPAPKPAPNANAAARVAASDMCECLSSQGWQRRQSVTNKRHRSRAWRAEQNHRCARARSGAIGHAADYQVNSAFPGLRRLFGWHPVGRRVAKLSPCRE